MEEKRLFYMDEIDPKGIMQDLFHNLWVIILAMLSAIMLVSVLCNSVLEEKYTSEATIAIINTGSATEYSGLTTSAGMAEALSQVFASDILWDKLENELGYEPEGSLEVSPIANTNLVLLEMTADTAGEAYKELLIILENYSQFSEYIFSNADLSMLSEPSIPQEPSNQINIFRYSLFAALAVMFLCIAFITGASVMRRTVKNRASANRWIDTDVYGVIVHEEKNKTLKQKIHRINKAALIINPTCSFSFEESFNRLVSKIIFHMETEHQQILLVTSGAENEGKSTVVANIALVMAKRGKKVLLMDTDFRKPALYKVFDYNAGEKKIFCLNEYIMKNDDSEEVLIQDERTGLLLALCNEGSKNPEVLISSEQLKNFLERMRKKVDYIILDSAPAGVAGDAEILAGLSDAALFVIRHDYVHVNHINYALDNLKNSGTDLMGCILNDMYGDNSEKSMKRSGYHGYADRKANYDHFDIKKTHGE